MSAPYTFSTVLRKPPEVAVAFLPSILKTSLCLSLLEDSLQSQRADEEEAGSLQPMAG